MSSNRAKHQLKRIVCVSIRYILSFYTKTNELFKTKRILLPTITDSSDQEDEGDVPMAQRKRFTRVEMARVLMERNQVS